MALQEARFASKLGFQFVIYTYLNTKNFNFRKKWVALRLGYQYIDRRELNNIFMISLIETSNCDRNYQLIAKAIAFMSENYLQQPDLATVAAHVSLSEYHFQRLFTRWAGISPKRFLQYLTVEYAKAKIAETKSLLNLTGDVGLSSPGRLHDLFVKLEAMSPGEFKAGGTGLQIMYGVHESPFGECLIAMTSRGICNLRFLDDTCKDVEQFLRLEWSKAEIVQERQATKEICDRIFAPVVTSQPLVVFVKGTNFQIQVWRGLLKVPFAGLATYQSLAKAIGHPTSARAVGNALGNNPVGYIIPCHRVIRESGELGGFRWGLERKKVLLGWEASQNQR